MPSLEWIGKRKVINHHQVVPYKLLNLKYEFGINSTKNLIVQGDNLFALKALLPQFEGEIKLTYLDPPYNTGKEKWVYNDNVSDPAIQKRIRTL